MWVGCHRCLLKVYFLGAKLVGVSVGVREERFGVSRESGRSLLEVLLVREVRRDAGGIVGIVVIG